MKIKQLEQSTPEWLAFRRNGIGGSDVASAMGLKDAFRTRAELISEKLGMLDAPVSDYLAGLFADGHIWEQVVRDKFNEQGFNFVPAVVCDEVDDRIFASLDGLDVDKELILEVKYCSTLPTFKKYTTKIPDHYYAQVQYALGILQYKKAIIAFVHDGEVVALDIESDRVYQAAQIVAVLDCLRDIELARNDKSLAPIQYLSSPEMERLTLLKQTEKQMKDQLAVVEEEVKALAAKLMQGNGATRIENESVSIAYSERKGNIDYSLIEELKNIDLEKFRKKPSTSILVKLK